MSPFFYIIHVYFPHIEEGFTGIFSNLTLLRLMEFPQTLVQTSQDITLYILRSIRFYFLNMLHFLL